MRVFVSIAYLLSISIISVGQVRTDIHNMIIRADSILLVKHKQTDGYVRVDGITGKTTIPAKVVVNGRPNYKVIIESAVLPDSNRVKIVEILTRKSNDRTIQTCNTFIPFHAILVIKDGKASYIDICIACNTLLIVSEKIKTSPLYIGKQNMKELSTLFKSVNITID